MPARHTRKNVDSAETVISSLQLFHDLSASSLKNILKTTEVRQFDAGHVFFRAGDRGYALFLLEEGHVQTFRTKGRRKLIIADLKPPAIFGEMGCVGSGVYHCAAEATEPSRIRMIFRKEVDALLERHPQITRLLLDLVSERFVRLLLDLESSSFRQLIPRLARLLLENIQAGCVSNMTHKEIAEHLRVYRESATTALGELKRAGIVTIERRQIRILDRARLERAARE